MNVAEMNVSMNVDLNKVVGEQNVHTLIEPHYNGDPDDPTYGHEASLKEIADELGFSIAGAKQLLDNALSKAQFVGAMSSEDITIMTMVTVKDYINYLFEIGDLTVEETQLLCDNPTIVSELDGFREYLHRYIKRRMRD